MLGGDFLDMLAHIITNLMKILNVKGLQAEGFFKYDKWKCFISSYTVLDSHGEACMLFKFEDPRWPSYKLSKNKAIYSRVTHIQDLIKPFIGEMIKEKVGFGALMVYSNTIMIELDFERFEIKEDEEKRNSISEFPYKYHIGREDHIKQMYYQLDYVFPSYLQLLLAWMIKSLNQSEIMRFEMDRFRLKKLNGLEDSEQGG